MTLADVPYLILAVVAFVLLVIVSPLAWLAEVTGWRYVDAPVWWCMDVLWWAVVR